MEKDLKEILTDKVKEIEKELAKGNNIVIRKNKNNDYNIYKEIRAKI